MSRNGPNEAWQEHRAFPADTQGPKIGLAIAVPLCRVKLLWRHKSAQCLTWSPVLLGRDAREKETGAKTKAGKRKEAKEKSGRMRSEWGLSPGLLAVPRLDAPLCSEMRKGPCTWASPGEARGGGRAWADPALPPPLLLPPPRHISYRETRAPVQIKPTTYKLPFSLCL